MSHKREIVIDLDTIAGDPKALGKLYECGSLLVQSSKKEESALGYKMLDMVDQLMNQPGNHKLKDS